MLYIRTDANKEIGTGHVMRCLAIAEKLRSSGENVCFITADEHSRDFIAGSFETICLSSVWNDLETEKDKLRGIIKERGIKKMLFDTYFVTYNYLTEIKKHVYTAYIDDLHKFAYPADLLINYNIFASKACYNELYRGHTLPKLALGCAYAPLRDGFCGTDKAIPPVAEKIMVTTGGTDNYNITGSFIESFITKKWFDSTEFYFILGKFNTDAQTLKARYGGYKNVHFLVNVTDMEKYMKMCDIAVTAGGSTVYELCACGTPSVICTLADNQLEVAATVNDMGIMLPAGDVRQNASECARAAAAHIGALISDREKRADMSKKMMSLVDGKGTERITALLSAV